MRWHAIFDYIGLKISHHRLEHKFAFYHTDAKKIYIENYLSPSPSPLGPGHGPRRTPPRPPLPTASIPPRMPRGMSKIQPSGGALGQRWLICSKMARFPKNLTQITEPSLCKNCGGGTGEKTIICSYRANRCAHEQRRSARLGLHMQCDEIDRS